MQKLGTYCNYSVNAWFFIAEYQAQRSDLVVLQARTWSGQQLHIRLDVMFKVEFITLHKRNSIDLISFSFVEMKNLLHWDVNEKNVNC